MLWIALIGTTLSLATMYAMLRVWYEPKMDDAPSESPRN